MNTAHVNILVRVRLLHLNVANDLQKQTSEELYLCTLNKDIALIHGCIIFIND